MTQLNPYIHFDGNARQAMEFYKGVFGGTLTLNTFKENNMSHDASDDNKIMHAMLTSDKGLVLMAADSATGWEYVSGKNVSMSLSGEDETELRGYWDKLADGSTVEQPLEKAPWGDTFGMLTDKFGIRWMVNVTELKG